MADRIDQFWLWGTAEDTHAACNTIYQALSRLVDKVLLAGNRRELWHSGERVGLMVPLSDYTPGAIDNITQQLLQCRNVRLSLVHHANDSHTVALRFPGQDREEMILDARGMAAADALWMAAGVLGQELAEARKTDPVHPIAQAAWMGGEALAQALADTTWNDQAVGQWWRTIQDWMVMGATLAGPSGQDDWGRSWSWEERMERVETLMRGLPGIHRETDDMVAVCAKQSEQPATFEQTALENELRQRALAQWLSLEETWTRGKMSLSLRDPNRPWTMKVFQRLPPHAQQEALDSSQKEWVNQVSYTGRPLSITSDLAIIWKATQSWSEWPSTLAHWHSLRKQLSSEACTTLDALEAERQGLALERQTPAAHPGRSGPRL